MVRTVPISAAHAMGHAAMSMCNHAAAHSSHVLLHHPIQYNPPIQASASTMSNSEPIMLSSDTADTAPTSTEYPHHIAIIMDGNGRWAKKRGLPRSLGHRQGVQTLRNLLPVLTRHRVAYVTLYTFSAENWQRPKEEVSALMRLLKQQAQQGRSLLDEHSIRLRIIGERDQLDHDLQTQLQALETATASHTGLTLILALSYGGRQELVQAARTLAREAAGGSLAWEDINADMLQSQLYTVGMPPPDLLIRTGGEQRISNFLLWQLAYTELWFTDTLWPDFTAENLQQALDTYRQRERRYGR